MLRPLFETVDEREFTNRAQELAFLWDLTIRARERRAGSQVFIARKGLGKTALLQRFYNDLFSQQTEVVPFFVDLGQFKGPDPTPLTVRGFMKFYVRTLATQYLAFHLKEGGMLEAEPDERGLLTILQAHEPLIPQAPFVAQYLRRSLEMTVTNYRDELPSVIKFTRQVLGKADFLPGVLMIDEFQVLTEVVDDQTGLRDNLAQRFQKTAEARWCPMVVTGSAVSLITRTTQGGLLARRFSPYHLQPFSSQHTLEYATRLATYHHVPLHQGVAYTIHWLTGGNPYYIWSLFNSKGLVAAGLSTLEALHTTYEYELATLNGELRNFWDVHFETMVAHLNAQGDALRILYHLATRPGEDFNLHDLADYLGRDPVEVESILTMLERADLVEARLRGLYRHITDPVLADYIIQRYRIVLEQQSFATYLKTLKADFYSKMGSLSRAVGHAAELFTIGLMTRFDGQEVDGAFFGQPGNIILPRFEKVVNRSGVIIEGDHIEFDIVAEGEEETWLVEVRHRQRPLGP
ncbi:MAG: hypothetical protein ACE5GO_11450, partial [Anaerolineales bacterium]